MDRLTAMQVFVEVAERASLTDAAEALDLSRAMVSRYVVGLEQWLGVRLLHRTTRRVSLTDAGAEAIERCKQVLEVTRDVQAVAGARRVQPKGKLRITASTSFAQRHLAGAMVEFLSRYPQTQIELLAMERVVNLVEDRIDLAVRIGRQLDDGLVARPLGVCHSVICASPAYLAKHGAPRTPNQLSKHQCITHAQVGRTEFVLLREGRVTSVPVRSAFQSNDVAVTCRAALGGGGIALLPTYFVSGEIKRGELVRLLPDYEPEPLGIYAAYLSRAHQPLLLRLMVDFLAERFGGEVASWDQEIAAARASRSKRARQPV
ncbi:MAG TPA: LysR family transcriptional regulator [Burkholderiaceae bacterium]|nr:LysR family transcriptional regulator [Burkholderiaceae bacterium]HQR69593.1 LysR family transcriptional regulator [Burkholderiaceae bacterium]